MVSSGNAVHDERTPLVTKKQDDEYPQKPETPLPRKQIAVLCLMRLTEPISYTVIFPFITQMLKDVHAAPDLRSVGYYAGLLEGLFSLAQMCTVLLWSRLSDRIGRKPVLLTGSCGVMISVAAFGLQKSFAGMLMARVFAGLMNGNVAILKSVLGEITDETNQARGFALLPVTFALGLIGGPIIGGFLAQPATQYPHLFGGSEFLREYPYFLPCAVAAALNLCSFLLGLFCFQETLNTLPEKGGAAAGPRERPQPVKLSKIMTIPLAILFSSAFMLDLSEAAWSALVPLHAYTALVDGGFALSFSQIGLALSLYGIMCIAVSLFLFPRLQRRFGILGLHRRTILTHPLRYFCLALLGKMAGFGGWSPGARQAALIAVLAIQGIGTMSRSCSDILVNNSAPTRSALASINGLQQMLASVAFTVGPSAATALFAFSINEQVLDGNFVWIVLMVVSGITVVSTLPLRESKATWYKSQAGALRDSEDPHAGASESTNMS